MQIFSNVASHTPGRPIFSPSDTIVCAISPHFRAYFRKLKTASHALQEPI